MRKLAIPALIAALLLVLAAAPVLAQEKASAKAKAATAKAVPAKPAPPAKAEPAPDPAVLTQAAAEKYYEISEFEKMVEKSLEPMLGSLSPEQVTEFRTLLAAMFRKEDLKKQVISATARHFELAEINAMVDFYGSPVGRSILGKMPAYTKEVSQLMQHELMLALSDRMAQKAGEKKAEEKKAEEKKPEEKKAK